MANPEQRNSNADYNPFDDADVISVYSDEQAIKDEVLFDLGEINRHWRTNLVNLVTMNLLISKGFATKVTRTPRWNVGDINVPALTDLVSGVSRVLHAEGVKDIAKHGEPKTLYTGFLPTTPSGEVFECWCGMNFSGRYTILLPSDY